MFYGYLFLVFGQPGKNLMDGKGEVIASFKGFPSFHFFFLQDFVMHLQHLIM